MKRISKPGQLTDLSALRPKAEDLPLVSDISVGRLIDDGLQILYREMRNLMMLSASGKLDASNARDLRDTVKLLFEIQERENSMLKGLTDEQLKAIADGDK